MFAVSFLVPCVLHPLQDYMNRYLSFTYGVGGEDECTLITTTQDIVLLFSLVTGIILDVVDAF